MQSHVRRGLRRLIHQILTIVELLLVRLALELGRLCRLALGDVLARRVAGAEECGSEKDPADHHRKRVHGAFAANRFFTLSSRLDAIAGMSVPQNQRRASYEYGVAAPAITATPSDTRILSSRLLAVT